MLNANGITNFEPRDVNYNPKNYSKRRGSENSCTMNAPVYDSRGLPNCNSKTNINFNSNNRKVNYNYDGISSGSKTVFNEKTRRLSHNYTHVPTTTSSNNFTWTGFHCKIDPNSKVSTNGQPLPVFNYTSNTNSTCSSYKEDLKAPIYPPHAGNYHRTKSIPLNQFGSMKLGMALSNPANINSCKRRSFTFYENDNFKQKFQIGNIPNHTQGNTNLYKNTTYNNNSYSSSSNTYTGNTYNKFNIPTEEENTEVLTVNLKFEGEKLLKINKLDDVLSKVTTFFEDHKLPENMLIPVVKKISDGLSQIYNVYNEKIMEKDVEYLGLLSNLYESVEGVDNLVANEKQTQVECVDSSYELNVTSISSITLKIDQSFKEEEGEGCSIYTNNNKSF